MHYDQLTESRLLHEVWESAPFGIAIVQRDGTFVRANPAYCAMLGYTEGELQRIKFGDITVYEDRAADVAASNRLADDPEGEAYRMAKSYVAKFGRSVRAIVDVCALRKDGGFVCYLIFCQPLAEAHFKIEEAGGNVVVRPVVRLGDLWRDNRKLLIGGGALLIAAIKALDLETFAAAWKILRALIPSP